MGIKSATFPATVEIMEDGETVRVSANFMLEPSSILQQLLGRNITKGWQSSDHVLVSVPSLGRKQSCKSTTSRLRSSPTRTRGQWHRCSMATCAFPTQSIVPSKDHPRLDHSPQLAYFIARLARSSTSLLQGRTSHRAHCN
jgi:hypothetical protein